MEEYSEGAGRVLDEPKQAKFLSNRKQFNQILVFEYKISLEIKKMAYIYIYLSSNK